MSANTPLKPEVVLLILLQCLSKSKWILQQLTHHLCAFSQICLTTVSQRWWFHLRPCTVRERVCYSDRSKQWHYNHTIFSSTTASHNCIRWPKRHFWHTEEHEIKWLIHSLYRWEEKHDEFKKVRPVFKTMNTKSCEDDSCETIPERRHEVLLQIIVLCQWKTPL